MKQCFYSLLTFLVLLDSSAIAVEPGMPKWMSDGVFKWTASVPLIAADPNAAEPEVALKDPTFVLVDGQWHLFATHRMASGVVDMQHLSFADWEHANAATRTRLPLHDEQYHCAPQVFWYSPHKLWYLIFQLADERQKLRFGPYYSTTETIAEPSSWSKPKPMFTESPDGTARPRWIDFWVICDSVHAHLFYTSDDGNFWRCQATRTDFPLGWSKPELVMSDHKNELFEASHTYKLKGFDQYLTLIEAIGPEGRYYKAWLAERLEGPWTPLAATLKKPFASLDNVTQTSPWTTSISHGELVRSGIDETLEVDPHDLRFAFQGFEEGAGKNRYGSIPWRIGMLKQINE